MTVVPAYGRDYNSARAAEMAWQDGQDFAHPMIGGQPAGGSYVSIRDTDAVIARGCSHVRIRYDLNRKCVDIALEPLKSQTQEKK